MQNPTVMITNVVVRPNPFVTSLTLEAICDQCRQTIVRLYNKRGRFLKLFTWYMENGTNITDSHMESLAPGSYYLDIVDNHGNIIFETEVMKEEGD